MIEMVLGTDMKGHFSIISHFGSLHRISANNSGGAAPSIRSLLSRTLSGVGRGSVASDCDASAAEVRRP